MNLLDWYKKRKQKKSERDLISDIRHAIHLDKDILPEKQIAELTALAEQAEEAERAGRMNVPQFTERFTRIYGKHSMRSLLDILLVALTVAFGVRALFLQPFQIPTGSMQPTLFGIHYIDTAEAEPGFMTKLYQNIFGTEVSGSAETAPDEIQRYLDADAVRYDGLLSTGDHLFVDRVSLHFLPFRRGEIIIFNTEGLTYQRQPLSGYFYIKRLIGMPGDTLKIVNDMVWIKPAGEKEFRPATDFSKKFDRIYSGQGGYHGHIPLGYLAEGAEYTVPEDMFFVLGDNSRNSLDSRYWGCVPRKNVIGRAMNVFWPISRRWGWIDILDALPVPSGEPNPDRPDSQMPAMRLQ